MTGPRPYGSVYAENATLRHENDRMLSMLADLAMRNGGEITADADLDRAGLEIATVESPIPSGHVTVRVRRIQTIEGIVIPNGQKVIEG